MKKCYLISYDVRDGKRLRKTAKLMEGYGVRIQYSVFRCNITERSLERLRWELSRVLLPEDGLLIVGLCTSCLQGVKKRNPQSQWLEETPAWEVL